MPGEWATGGGHAGDGDLVRLLDGEVEDPALRAHVESCDGCRRRFREIEAWSRGVTRALRDADPLVRDADAGAPDTRRGRRDTERPRTGRGGDGGPPSSDRDIGRRGASGARSAGIGAVPVWLRVAAGIVLLLAAGLAVEPVRAWVVEQVERVGRGLALLEPSGPGARSGGRGTAVSFVPAGGEIVVRLAAPQQEGRIVVAVSQSGPEVTASVTDAPAGAPGPALSVLPSELRIRNDPASRASYRVSVPASTEAVEVRVGGRRLARIPGAQLRPGRRWSWALAASDAPAPDPG